MFASGAWSKQETSIMKQDFVPAPMLCLQLTLKNDELIHPSLGLVWSMFFLASYPPRISTDIHRSCFPGPPDHPDLLPSRGNVRLSQLERRQHHAAWLVAVIPRPMAVRRDAYPIGASRVTSCGAGKFNWFKTLDLVGFRNELGEMRQMCACSIAYLPATILRFLSISWIIAQCLGCQLKFKVAQLGISWAAKLQEAQPMPWKHLLFPQGLEPSWIASSIFWWLHDKMYMAMSSCGHLAGFTGTGAGFPACHAPNHDRTGGRSSKSSCCRTLAKQPKLGFVLKKKSEMQGEHHKSNSSGSSV